MVEPVNGDADVKQRTARTNDCGLARVIVGSDLIKGVNFTGRVEAAADLGDLAAENQLRGALTIASTGQRVGAIGTSVVDTAWIGVNFKPVDVR